MEQSGTWLKDKTSAEFMEAFEAIPGNSGLYKFDLEKIVAFQKHYLLLKGSEIEESKKVIMEVAHDKGYFDLFKISENIRGTLKILDKANNSLVLYPGGKDGEDLFVIDKEFLLPLSKALVDDFDHPYKIGKYEFNNIDDSELVAISLSPLGLDHIYVIASEEFKEDIVSSLDTLEGFYDIASVSKSIGRGIVLANRKKKSMAFVLSSFSTSEVIDLHYLEVLDIYSELKRISG